jgi:hypothetical protein
MDKFSDGLARAHQFLGDHFFHLFSSICSQYLNILRQN